MEEFQLNQKLCFDEASPRFANKDSRSRRSPARGQQIIYQHNLFPRVNSIDVHLHFRFAVLERITGDLSLKRKLAPLSDRNETDTKLIGHRRSKEEPASVDPNDLINLSPAATIQKQIDGRMEKSGITQDRRNIFEYDTLLRKIGYVAYSDA